MYEETNNMPDYDFDLFVIGAGSGGVRAARTAAGYGARVAIAEERYLGGTCVNVGCIPKKLFFYASRYSGEFRHARAYGWDAGVPRLDWQRLLENKNREIERLNGVYERLLRDAGVRIMDGRARLADGHTVAVVGAGSFTAERILVATGGWPFVPDFPGRQYAITSNEAFFLDTLPDRILVAGGGYTASEFAGIFNGMGVDTTIVHRDPYILKGFDQEIRERLCVEMRKQGVKLVLDTFIERIDKDGPELSARLLNGDTLRTDAVLVATGRRPNTRGLGLAEAGVELNERGAVAVNAYYQSSVPSVYAIGDVTNRQNLTPVAIAEAIAFARSNYGGTPAAVDYHNIPTCIFSHPVYSTVGLTEESAREKYAEVEVYKSGFTPLLHTLTGSDERSFIKLLVDKGTGKILGAHMIGADAGEIMQGLAIAMSAGATKADFDRTIGIHPTAAEEFVTLREPAA